ncbi:hypothetical protein ACFQU2_30615 [Siccirubricoccus deserti]
MLVVAAENQAQRRSVRLGQTLNDQVVIENGLEGGETVISEGLQRVRPGQPVNPGPAGQPPRPPAGAAAPGRQG